MQKEVAMNIKELFELQKQLESKASLMSGIEETALGEENVLNVRMLALQVKFGEMANLTKCYKYKKDLGEIPKNKILFRYVEGMIYLLSLGNKYNLNVIDDYAFQNEKTYDDLIVNFTTMFESLVDLKRKLEQDQYIAALNLYIRVFANYIHLGRLLNIEYDEALSYFHDMSYTA